MAPSRKPRARVLLVDDDKAQTMLAKARLVAVGYEVTAANDAVHALMLAGDEPPDVIVSDYLMDSIHGPEFCASVRSTAALAHIPFILVSAWDFSRREREQVMKVGVNLIVERTPNFGALIAAIESLLRPMPSK